MNKTAIETTLPCGCVELRWLFGRTLKRRCSKHLFHATIVKTWGGKANP